MLSEVRVRKCEKYCNNNSQRTDLFLLSCLSEVFSFSGQCFGKRIDYILLVSVVLSFSKIFRFIVLSQDGREVIKLFLASS